MSISSIAPHLPDVDSSSLVYSIRDLTTSEVYTSPAVVVPDEIDSVLINYFPAPPPASCDLDFLSNLDDLFNSLANDPDINQ